MNRHYLIVTLCFQLSFTQPRIEFHFQMNTEVNRRKFQQWLEPGDTIYGKILGSTEKQIVIWQQYCL